MKFSLPPHWHHFNQGHSDIEQNVTDRTGSYKGLMHEALYTSDEDLLEIIHHPLVNGKLVDLGCGMGKLPLLYGTHFPERKSVGIEYENSRLKKGLDYKEQFQLNNVLLLNDDLLSCDIPEGDTYFLYFPTGHVLDRVLSELYKLNFSFHLVVIESHGDLLARLDLENWLESLSEIKLTSERHYPLARIYRKLPVIRTPELVPFEQSYRKKFIQVNDWIGETFGMEWVREDRFELQIPPRTIHWKDVKKLMVFEELNDTLKLAVTIRRGGAVTIRSKSGVYEGLIRKIIITPVFSLELSGGEKVEWSEILNITRGLTTCYESSPSF
jgi:hypothetical protein